MYDSVKLLAKALHDLDQSKSINIKSLSCDTEKPWTNGGTLNNYMKMVRSASAHCSFRVIHSADVYDALL